MATDVDYQASKQVNSVVVPGWSLARLEQTFDLDHKGEFLPNPCQRQSLCGFDLMLSPAAPPAIRSVGCPSLTTGSTLPQNRKRPHLGPTWTYTASSILPLLRSTVF